MSTFAPASAPSLEDVDRVVRDPVRLAALRSLGLLDSPPEEAFDRLVRLSGRILRTPVALVTLVDEDRQFFKAAVGIPADGGVVRQTPLSHSVCRHTIALGNPLAVADARLDPVLQDNPAIPDFGFVAYLGVPLTDSSGQALGALCVIDHQPREWLPADVETLEALAASVITEIELRRFRHEQVQQLVDHAPAIVFAKDLAGRYLLVNRQFEEDLRTPRDVALGRLDTELFPPELAERYRDHDRRVIETGRPLEIEESAALPDGTRTYVSLKFPLFEPAGDVYAIAGISYDITERRRAEEALVRSNEAQRVAWIAAEAARTESDAARRLLQGTLERVTDGFVALDPDWRYTYVNERAAELLGRPPDQLVGKGYYEEFPEAVGTPFEQAYRRAMTDQTPMTLDAYYEPWDRWFENRIYPSPDGLSIFFSEVTERKRAERERERLHEQLERQAAELEDRVRHRTEDLEAANRELQAFAYTVSHDLRAPLRSMEGFGQALLEDHGQALGAEGRRFAQRITGAAARMSELIEDLLAYSQLSRRELHLGRVDLEQIVQDARAQVEGELMERGAAVVVEQPLPDVIGHRRTLVQVVANLLSNAAKFVPPDTAPRIVVRTEALADAIRLWVEDNGIGIAPEHQDQIFRVFERLHGTETYPGTGIGLAIVRKGAEQMGGQAGVVSAGAGGSRFWVELRAAEAGTQSARR